MKTLLSITLITAFLTTTGYAAPRKMKVKRKISSDVLVEGISEKDVQITNELNSIISAVKPAKLDDGSPNYAKTATTVKNAIAKILQVAANNPKSDVAQLYKSAAEHIPLFRGFIYRLRKVAEVSDVAYLSAIWALKQFKQTSSFRAPYMEALFDMATMPNPEEIIEGQKGMFKTVSDLQDWMVNIAAPRFSKTIQTIKEIAYRTGDGVHPIGMMNAELLVGKVIAQKYVPAKHAHKEWILTSGHLIGLVSALENYMGFLYYTSSYNLEKLAELSNILTQETFIEIKGATSRSKIFNSAAKRVDLLSTKRIYELTHPMRKKGKKNKSQGLFGARVKSKPGVGNSDFKNYRNFMTLRPSAKRKVKGTDHENYLKAAEYYFVNAAKDQLEYHHAMVETYGMSGEDKLVVNPASYKATLDLTPYIDQTEVLENSVRVLEANGPVVLKDQILSKSYTVNVSTLFDVNAVNDLRKFLPNKFNDSRKERSPETAKGINWLYGGKGRIQDWKNTFSWNYSYNKAKSWKAPQFNGLFPNISTEQKGDEFALHLLNISSLPEIPYVGLWLGMFYGY